MPVTTAVTCPTIRIHPAVIAQATATAAAMLPGRFGFGVGSGEELNEQILGDRWPEADERLEISRRPWRVIRLLWSGETVSHRGRHYRVQNARIYTLPERPPPILVSGFGPKAVDLAGCIGDGYCITHARRRAHRPLPCRRGRGKPVQAGMKVCYGADEAEARRTAHHSGRTSSCPASWPRSCPTPPHFEQASTLVSEEMIADAVPCGPDLDRHREAIQEFADAGVDKLYIQQIGRGRNEFFEVYAREVLPRFDS